jgi:hypothetical protein
VAYATVAVGQNLPAPVGWTVGAVSGGPPAFWKAAPAGAALRGAECRVVSQVTGQAVALGELGEVWGCAS